MPYILQSKTDPPMYYTGSYTIHGPVLSSELSSAYKFPERVNAEYMIGGDERFRGWEVKDA